MAKNIKIVLLHSVKGLGLEKDVIAVRPGFARNFLFPKRLATRASEKLLKELEENRLRIQDENLIKKMKAEEISSIMKDLLVIIPRPSSQSGHLYGSVRVRDVFKEILKLIPSLSSIQARVILNHPIRKLGTYSVQVALYKDILARVTLNVVSQMSEVSDLEKRS